MNMRGYEHIFVFNASYIHRDREYRLHKQSFFFFLTQYVKHFFLNLH